MADVRKYGDNGNVAESRVGELHSVDGGVSTDGAEQQHRLPVLKTYKLYIDGAFPRTESGRYYQCHTGAGEVLANICRGSKKDLRNAVAAARKACDSWGAKSAYLRGQIIYRVAEMLEGRRPQFVHELCSQGLAEVDAAKEVDAAVDRLVYFAGWSDKYQQIFSTVNPVSSSHFNFSMPEPVGVVGIVAPERSALLGLVSALAPVIVGGNTCVLLASQSKPLAAVTFSEVLHSSDVPAGVINILTGLRAELLEPMTGHMDINAIVSCGLAEKERSELKLRAAENVKRVITYGDGDWSNTTNEEPYAIINTQEIKTTWHPIGK